MEPNVTSFGSSSVRLVDLCRVGGSRQTEILEGEWRLCAHLLYGSRKRRIACEFGHALGKRSSFLECLGADVMELYRLRYSPGR